MEDVSYSGGDESGMGGCLRSVDVERAMTSLSQEVRELSLGVSGEVERVRGPLAPLRFLRDYVMPGKPCIITDAIDHWPALHRWSNEYLCSVLKEHTVSVHFTPDGRADAVVDPYHMHHSYGCIPASFCDNTDGGNGSTASWVLMGQAAHPANLCASRAHDSEPDSDESVPPGMSCVDGEAYEDTRATDLLFVTAHVEHLPFPEALEVITRDPPGRDVAYAQQQDGCFLTEYIPLAKDAEEHIPWATEALGCVPEAVNIWIGNERAVTSFHKDHYENLYAVVAGEKHFTLLPPTDVHRLYVGAFPPAQYVRHKDSGDFFVLRDLKAPEVPWVSVDPYPPVSQMSAARAKFPKYFDAPLPFKCTVKAGEILYLPSLWFHHVRQSTDSERRTIAINYWYDMEFDIKFAYFNFLTSLSEESRNSACQ